MATKRTSKRGRGRPPMAKGESMTDVIAVRVKHAEKRHLTTVAKAAKKTLGTWARDALLAAAGDA